MADRKLAGLALALPAAISVVLLTGCSSDIEPASSLPDGTYTGVSEPDLDGATGTVEFTVSSGKVTDASFIIHDADGTPRDDNYGKTASGEITDQRFYDRAQHAIAAEKQYVTQFEELGDQNSIESIAGASISYRHFVDAVKNAITNAG